MEHTVGNCRECKTPIYVDEAHEELGESILIDGVLCEICSVESKIQKIRDYIAGCEDDAGFVFNNQAEHLLDSALGVIDYLLELNEAFKEENSKQFRQYQVLLESWLNKNR